MIAIVQKPYCLNKVFATSNLKNSPCSIFSTISVAIQLWTWEILVDFEVSGSQVGTGHIAALINLEIQGLHHEGCGGGRLLVAW